MPWLIVITTNVPRIQDATGWTTKSLSLLFLAKTWGTNLTRLFVDLVLELDPSDLLTYLLVILTLLLESYSLYFLYHNTPK